MVKQKKKRNKTYSGSGASLSKPRITKVSAVHRNPPAQWWHDNKRIAKPVLIVAGIIVVVVILIVEAIRLTQIGS